MKKIIIILATLAIVLGCIGCIKAQGLGDSYTIANSKVRTGDYTNIKYEEDKDRHWIFALNDIGYTGFGFYKDKYNLCDIILTMPSSGPKLSGLIEYFNKNFVIVDSFTWDVYNRNDGRIVRIVLKTEDNGNQIFYYFFK